MGILESYGDFAIPDIEREEDIVEPRVGDLVIYDAKAAPVHVRFIGEHVAVFRPKAYDKNPNPGHRVPIYEAIEGSECYQEMMADPGLSMVRKREMAPQAEIDVNEGTGTSRIVVVPLDGLQRANRRK